jgi:DnaA family protein
VSDSARQLPLALRYPPDQRLDSFIEAPAGCIAQLRMLAEGDSKDWLYLQGADGVGKTHLALATCAAAEVAGLRAAYLPLPAASGRLRSALDALEGLDAIAGSRDDEIALFDFHNRARSNGQPGTISVLYTARATPDALAMTLPDLRSRLAQCTRIALSPMDEAGRRDVLRARAQRRGMLIEDAALDWMLKRVDRDLASLTTLLDQLDRASLAAQRRITVPFLREFIGSEGL